MARDSGRKVIIDEDIKGLATGSFEQVTPSLALSKFLHLKGIQLRELGDTFYVGSCTECKSEALEDLEAEWKKSKK